MHVLVVPTTDWTKHPSPHRHHYLVEEFAREHTVTVLRFPIFRRPGCLTTSAQIIETGSLPARSLAGYYLLNAPRHWRRVRTLLDEGSIDLILGANLLPSALAFQAARRHRDSDRPICIYDVSDYFPESASIYSRNAVSRRLLRLGSSVLMRVNLTLADALTSPSQALAERMAAIAGRNVEVIPNGVDYSRFRDAKPSDELRGRLECGEDVICFVGSLENWLDFDTVLQGFESLLQRNGNVHLVIVGGSIQTSYDQSLQMKIRAMGLQDSVTMTGFVPPERVPDYLRIAKVGIIPFRSELYMAQVAIPDKLFEYLACGLWVLSTHLPEVVEVARNHVAFYRSADEFTLACESLLQRSDRNLAGQRFASFFDWGRSAERVINLARRVVSSASE